MKNAGKRFEDCFKRSVPDYCLLQRLNDPPQSFIDSADTRFSPKNPCDFFVFSGIHRILWCLELKTTKSKYMTFEDITQKKPESKMIHKHQILGLERLGQCDHVVAGFLLNFRDEQNAMERTYFQDIDNFLNMINSIGKFSFNEIDLLLNHAVKVKGVKKRTNYIWDIDKLFEAYAGR